MHAAVRCEGRRLDDEQIRMGSPKRRWSVCLLSKLQACQQTDSGCEAAPAPGRKLEQRSSYCSAAHLLMVARCRPTNLQSNICRSRLRALSAEGERSRWLRGNSVCTIFRGQQWVATWSSYLRVHIRSSRWLTRNSRPTGTDAVIEGCNSTSWREASSLRDAVDSHPGTKIEGRQSHPCGHERVVQL
jgi:hypothetical protein